MIESPWWKTQSDCKHMLTKISHAGLPRRFLKIWTQKFQFFFFFFKNSEEQNFLLNINISHEGASVNLPFFQVWTLSLTYELANSKASAFQVKNLAAIHPVIHWFIIWSTMMACLLSCHWSHDWNGWFVSESMNWWPSYQTHFTQQMRHTRAAPWFDTNWQEALGISGPWQFNLDHNVLD